MTGGARKRASVGECSSQTSRTTSSSRSTSSALTTMALTGRGRTTDQQPVQRRSSPVFTDSTGQALDQLLTAYEYPPRFAR